MPVIQEAPTAPIIESLATIRESTALAPFVTTGRKAQKSLQMPKTGNRRKPPTVQGFEWYRQGRGWACRTVTVIDGKRVRKYLGYLNAAEWERMQQAHTGAELKTAVKQWIEGKAKNDN